jgi:hypothetical protein
MNVKQKAEELVDKFIPHTNSDWDLGDIFQSQQCALIAVNELIKFGMFVKQPILDKSNKVKPNNSQIEYWKQVKQEIEKL